MSLASATKRVEPLIEVAIHQLRAGLPPEEVFEQFMEAPDPMPPSEWRLYEANIALVLQVAAFTMMDLKAGFVPPNLASR